MERDPLKAWARVLQTAQGFGKKHGHWPTRIVLPDAVHELLAESFTPEDWAFIKEQVQLRTGAARPRAEDEEGDSYIRGESLATRLTFEVDDPEPKWFALTPVSADAAEPHDPLAAALRRLGSDTFDPQDPVGSIERAVAQAGAAALAQIQASADAESPGSASQPLRRLLSVPEVRSILPARNFRRVQMAVLRVWAVEFARYFAATAGERSEAAKARVLADELRALLSQKPLSVHDLESLHNRAEDLAEDIAGASPENAEFAGLVQWAAALAVDERRLTQPDARVEQPEATEPGSSS